MNEHLKKLQAQRVEAEAVVASTRQVIQDAGEEATDEQFNANQTAIEAFEAVDAKVGQATERQAQLDRSSAISDGMEEPMENAGRGASSPNKGKGWDAGKERLFDHPMGGYREDTVGQGDFLTDVRAAEPKSGMPMPDGLRKWDNAVKSAAGDGMTGLTGHEGGYLVPVQLAGIMDKSRIEASVVRGRATTIQMTTNRMTFPWLDDSTHASGILFGGVLAYFRGEEDQLTETKPKFEDRELLAHKLTTLAYVTGEQLDFASVNLGSWLPMKMGQAMGYKEDDKFLNGTGAGEPEGFLGTASAISITAEAGQAADTIVFQNIVKQDARLWDLGGNIGWIANRTTKPQLSQLHLEIGTAGVPVFLPASAGGTDGMSPRPLQTLYGYPSIFSEKVPAIGDAGDLSLVNFSEYLIGDVTGKGRTDASIHLKFDYDQVAYRIITYTAGMCPWRTAFQPKTGDTLSPVVKIAARA